MDEKKRKKYDLFIAFTRKKSKEEILKKEQIKGRKLLKTERRAIIQKNAGKARLRAQLASLGIILFGTGAVGYKLLNSGKTTEAKQAIESELPDTQNEKDAFKDALKIDFDGAIKEYIEKEKIEDQIEQDVEQLNSSSNTLTFIKEAYINQYNEDHDTNYTTDNVRLYKSRMYELYQDKNLNGDKVYIINGNVNNNTTSAQSDIGIIKAEILDENEIILNKEMATKDYYTGEYLPVYSNINDSMNDNTQTILEMGNVISDGIDLFTAIKYQEDSLRANESIPTYKQKLVKSITNYKYEKQSETNIENDVDENSK